MTATTSQYTGRLALMALNGALEPCVITGSADKRLSVTKLGGESLSVALGRLYWVGQTRVDDLATLAASWQEIQRSVTDCDLDAAWAATTDAEVQPDCEVLAQAALGRVDAAACDAVPVAIFGNPQRFRVRGRRIERFTAAEVAATMEAEAEAARTQRINALSRDVVAGRLTGTPVADPDADAAYAQAVEALTDVVLNEDKAAPAHTEAAATLLAALERDADGAFDLLVALGEMSAHENMALRRSGCPTRFSKAVTDAAEAAAQRTLPVTRRMIDLRHLLTVAIDDPLTTEVDDAFAIDGPRLYVLIADVAAHVQPLDPLDVEASRRVSTIYLPEGTVPMLPRVIGEGAASLCEGVDQTALAFAFEVTDDGRLAGVEVARAQVRVDRQLTYEQADTVLSGDGDDPEVALLQQAETWMNAHREGRAQRGALFFQRNEVYMHVEDDGTVIRRVGDPYAPGRQLVSELMIATCRAAAEMCAEQGIPCIYRTQAAPDPGRGGAALADHPIGVPIVGAAAQMGLLRKLKPAVLSTRVKPHFTLGVGAYTQVTSPIRRYGDLLMHQQLTSVLETGRPRYTAGQLASHFDVIDRTTGAIRRVELDSKRYWAACYLAAQGDATLTGQVVREHGRRWLVELTDLALMLPAELRRGVQSGDMVEVRVKRADARAGKILLKHV